MCLYTVAIRAWSFTIILAHICFCIPFVIVSVRTSLSSMNPNLELAASDLGASRFKTFFYVVLPSLLPGILSGAELSLRFL